jgi:hypothetical protein
MHSGFQGLIIDGSWIMHGGLAVLYLILAKTRFKPNPLRLILCL